MKDKVNNKLETITNLFEDKEIKREPIARKYRAVENESSGWKVKRD